MIHSLRLRLLLGGAAWILVALALAAFAIIALFDLSARRHLAEEMQNDVDRIIAIIDPAATLPNLRNSMSDVRYALPYGGKYWQVTTGTGVLRSPSMWGKDMPDHEPTPDLGDTTGPDGRPALLIAREVTFGSGPGARTYMVSVATTRAILEREIVRFASDVLPALLALAVVLFGAAALQVRIGLRPLARVRDALQHVRVGRAARLEADRPSEVVPLVAEINELLDTKDKLVATARMRAADLAHGLRTPLTALHATANRMESDGASEHAAVVRELANQMSDRVDYQLRLSQLRPVGGGGASSSINVALSRSLGVVRKTERGETIDWHVDLGDDARVNLDQHDVLELMGVLIENAVKWARGRVDIRTTRLPDGVSVSIEDDGPGLTPQQIEQLGVRGLRLDQGTSGFGLGLAIATEILRNNNAQFAFGRSDLGGLLVQFTLPADRFVASPDDARRN